MTLTRKIRGVLRGAFTLLRVRPRRETAKYPRLVRRRNGYFYLKYSPYEKTSLKTKDPLEARRLLNLEVERLRSNRDERERAVSHIMLGEFREEYRRLRWWKVLKGEISGETYRNDNLAFRKFHESVGDVAIRKISRQDVMRFRETFFEGYANSLLGHLRAAFSYAVEQGYIDFNPFSASRLRPSVFYRINDEGLPNPARRIVDKEAAEGQYQRRTSGSSRRGRRKP